ncbi:hypothetical protein ACWDSJ_27865 [Nocardia sp. NPDC003482]
MNLVVVDRDCPVTVLLDPDDNAAVTHALLAAHDPDAGIVVVHPTPGVQAARGLGADVMAALGRPPGRLAAERISGPDAVWNAVSAWTTAEPITHLVVLRAHRLIDRQHRKLLQLHWLTGVHLVLVWHTRHGDPSRDLDLTGLPHRIVRDPSALLAQLHARAALDEPRVVADEPDLPPVPYAEFDRFRADAARTLSADQFARLDTVYAWTQRQVCRALVAHAHASADSCWEHPVLTAWSARARFGDDRPHTGRLPLRTQAARVGEYADYDRLAEREEFPRWTDRRWLRELLVSLVADSPGPNYTVTRLRGAQAAFGLHGWRLDLPNLPFAVGPGLTTVPITSALIHRIRTRTTSPTHAAGLALTLATGAPQRELLALRGDSLTEDATFVRSGQHRMFAVPPPARPLLLAARTFVWLTHPHRTGLLNHGIGAHGHTVRATADQCELRLPARHAWKLTWVANATARRHWPRLRPGLDAELRYALLLDPTLDDAAGPRQHGQPATPSPPRTKPRARVG